MRPGTYGKKPLTKCKDCLILCTTDEFGTELAYSIVKPIKTTNMSKIVYVLTIIDEHSTLLKAEAFSKELDAHTAMVEQMMEKKDMVEKDKCIVIDNFVSHSSAFLWYGANNRKYIWNISRCEIK